MPSEEATSQKLHTRKLPRAPSTFLFTSTNACSRGPVVWEYPTRQRDEHALTRNGSTIELEASKRQGGGGQPEKPSLCGEMRTEIIFHRTEDSLIGLPTNT